ncbi:MAG: ABC transporter ATP-binding protein [Cellulomonas sp. 73-92]|uniref:ABC transporter ATP-binding protein n=1 Tax=Cellulomonas sp. 73-92 TaxID=1895740 RepID=UPI00092B104B|nr:ABC transporter ATP-binding protein [Cellulomonas sp. 73-92]OJV81064.1 MAG: ABC transporter ATP-binding protein [Cellulomonas sp. 73-92]
MTAAPPTTPVLSIRDLSVSFRTAAGLVPAVVGASIDVHAGQTVALVGESGSGKSTTAATVNRLLPSNGRIVGGAVWYEGTDIADLPESQMIHLRGANIGLVPQDPMSNLNPLMRIGTQVAETLEVHGRATGKNAWAGAVELLSMVGIPDPERRARQYPHEFSGGMRQRALIAIGLACRPRLLIADEPTSALDVTVQRRVLDQLDELTDQLGTAVLLITHDLALAIERADRVVVMHGGRVVEQGGSREILGRPNDDYTRELLAAAPSLASVRTRPAPASAPVPLVQVRGLRKEFALRGERETLTAVDDVTFDIPRGQTVSLVGESGSGKSTTANMVLALETPTAGSILFDGADVAGFSRPQMFDFRRRVQPVFQNPYASLDPRYTVAAIVAEPLRVHRVGDGSQRRRAVGDLLDQVALPAALAERYPHELSGGQRQRVAIARALALRPDLVVLDEAVSALDVLVRAQILRLLDDLQRQLQLTYLFISHDLSVVRMISDEVHVMHRGRIVESGTPDDLFDHPQDPYTQELLAAIPGRAAG